MKLSALLLGLTFFAYSPVWAQLSDAQLQIDLASLKSDLAFRKNAAQNAVGVTKKCVNNNTSKNGGQTCKNAILDISIVGFDNQQQAALVKIFQEVSETRGYLFPSNNSNFVLQAFNPVAYHRLGHHSSISHLAPGAAGWVAQHWVGRGLTQLGGNWLVTSHPTYSAAVITHEARHEWTADHGTDRFGASVIGALAAVRSALNPGLAAAQRKALLDYAYSMVAGVRNARDRAELLDYVARARKVDLTKVEGGSTLPKPPMVTDPKKPRPAAAATVSTTPAAQSNVVKSNSSYKKLYKFARTLRTRISDR